MNSLNSNTCYQINSQFNPTNLFFESHKNMRAELKYFNYFEKSTEEIKQELLKIIPVNIDPIILLGCIFEECEPDVIPIVLKAFELLYPDFNFLPSHKIFSSIIGDENHLLNNSSLTSFFKQHDIGADDIIKCYDLAFRMSHPYIYQSLEVPISPKDYTLNFIWINLNPQDRVQNLAQHIFKDGLDPSENAECLKNPDVLRTLEESETNMEEIQKNQWMQIKRSFTYRITKWADMNPNAKMNLWYDSALVTELALKNTTAMMQEISKSRGVDIKLRDIRQLPNLIHDLKHSLHPATPVYYRVDILKALIADYMMASESEKSKFCVISDVDVDPMSPKQIFDKRTTDSLDSCGSVFNRNQQSADYENSFMIFNKEKKGLQQKHYKTVILPTLINIVSQRKYPHAFSGLHADMVLNSQFVYKQYRKFLGTIEEQNSPARKIAQCPTSQFQNPSFDETDYKAETFRFIGDSNIPYTQNGRNSHHCGEKQIFELVDWKEEPLSCLK